MFDDANMLNFMGSYLRAGMSNSNYIAGRKSIKNCLKGPQKRLKLLYMVRIVQN